MAKYIDLNGTKISVGDTVRVHQKIKEGEKSRIQIFEGAVIAISGREAGKTFTVRKIATGGIGVERIFPIHTPAIDKVELKQQGIVHRAKLYYLRDRVGKAATMIRKKIVQTGISK